MGDQSSIKLRLQMMTTGGNRMEVSAREYELIRRIQRFEADEYLFQLRIKELESELAEWKSGSRTLPILASDCPEW